MTDLKHELRPRQLFALAFGTVVGVGWITVLGHWLAAAGPLGAIVAFAAGGLLMLAIGLCYAEAASMMPSAGGEVVYAHRTFGPAAGFAAGWVLSLIYVSVTAFEAISVGWITAVLLPSLEGPVLYEAFGSKVSAGNAAVGLLGMVVIGYLNWRRARDAAGFQDVMTWLLILMSLVFIAAGLLRGNPAHLEPLLAAPELPGAAAGIATVFIMTPFFFAGFNVLPQAIGERSPEVSLRTVSILILATIVCALAFYVLVILASAMTLDRSEILAYDLPAAAAFRTAFDSDFLGNLVLVAGLLGLVTTWNAVFFAGSRVLLALSRAGSLTPALGTLHPEHGTPARAVLLIGVVATFMMLLGRGAIELIVNTVGFCFALMFLGVAATVIFLRIREPLRERPYAVPGGLWIPAVGALAAAGMVAISLWQHLGSADGMPAEWIILLTWAALGVALRLASRRRSHNRHTA